MKRTFLCNTVDAFGTINPLISLAKLLKSHGHNIVFLSTESFHQTIENCGFIYEAKLDKYSKLKSPQELAECLSSTGFLAAKSSTESMKIAIDSKIMVNSLLEYQKSEKHIITKLIEKYKPDIILNNSILGSAESVYSGIPWVGIYCENPLNMLNIYYNNLLPPYSSGFLTNGVTSEWREFKVLAKAHDELYRQENNKNYREYGFPEISTHFPISPYLNIYSYPKELDYSDIVSVPEKWFRVDSYFYNKSDDQFDLPKQLDNKCGKLVYLSMGTICSINLDLMKKLVTVLSKSPNRFIVSKGMYSSEYELYDNMWGDKYLPQTLILPKVDLVITHGGNNSISEALYFGKPMIVMPLFYDQFDNAQRIHETGFGIRLNAQLFTENELLSAIETLLNNTELTIKLNKVAERIQSDDSLEKAVEMVENL